MNAGLIILNTGVKPLKEMFQSIREFLTPKNITDIQAWLRTVTQVVFTYPKLLAMAPF